MPGQASALDIIMLQRENRRIQIACHEIRRTLKNFVKALAFLPMLSVGFEMDSSGPSGGFTKYTALARILTCCRLTVSEFWRGWRQRVPVHNTQKLWCTEKVHAPRMANAKNL